jgi:precorrin-6B methylase 2
MVGPGTLAFIRVLVPIVTQRTRSGQRRSKAHQQRGWRCWEVGAGGGGIPEALAVAVGLGGYVLATDINPVWLQPERDL